MALRKMKNKQIDLSGEKDEASIDVSPGDGVLDLRNQEIEKEKTINSKPLDLRSETKEQEYGEVKESERKIIENDAENKESEFNEKNEQIEEKKEVPEEVALEHESEFLARPGKKKNDTNKEKEQKVEETSRAEVAEIIEEERGIKEKLKKLEHRLEEIETKQEVDNDGQNIKKEAYKEVVPKDEEREEEEVYESKKKNSYTEALTSRFFDKKIKNNKFDEPAKENDYAEVDKNISNDLNQGSGTKNLNNAEREEHIQKNEEEKEVLQTVDREAPKEILEFPEGFLWGTSISAYQTEGGNNNDWSLWEKGGRRILSLQRQGKQPSDFICGRAVDSYNLWEKDLILAKKLSTKAIRFGLEWSRTEPKPSYWNIEAIEHYRELMAGAKKRGLKTFVTLWHWTLPNWVADKGGWSNKETIDEFLRYVELVIKELGGGVDYWVTLNEPMVHILNGYLNGKFPPGRKNIFAAWRAYNNLIKAHRGAYNLIHKHFPNAKVSFTKLHNYYEPNHRYNPIENALAWFFDYLSNQRILNKLEKYLDYIGFDYYFHDRIRWYPPFIKNRNLETTDMGWEIYPFGIYRGLKKLSRFNKPIFILENGLADAKDEKREDFIKDHLAYVHQAIEEGVDVRGYFYWSLLDNFEWDKGFEPKFGLYEVDRKTMKRSPRPSAVVYKDICKTNKVEIEE